MDQKYGVSFGSFIDPLLVTEDFLGIDEIFDVEESISNPLEIWLEFDSLSDIYLEALCFKVKQFDIWGGDTVLEGDKIFIDCFESA